MGTFFGSVYKFIGLKKKIMREFECDRMQYFFNVWKSCKTEEQRMHCERWIERTAKPWPSKERRHIMEYIEECKEILDDENYWRPIKEKNSERELRYKVLDQEERIKKLELKLEAFTKYAQKRLYKI